MVFQAGLIYSAKALGSLIIYLLTFQWLRDLSYLPLLAPEINPASILEDNIGENVASHLFSFSTPSNHATDQLVSGLINSFFFSLPFSLPHLVSIRRLFYQGTVAAGASVVGTILAHTLFLIGVIYGLRFLIIPWFSLEPLSYIIGVITIALIVHGMAQEKGIKIVPLKDKTSLLKMGALNFLLTWCEEITLFHSFNNLTLNAQTTYLDLYPSNTAFHSFILHTTYVLAFFLGNCLFSILFYYLLLIGGEYLRAWTGFTFAKMTRTLNKLMIFLIVGFTLSSFPYYGLDYLFTNMAGFLPEDPAYSNTVFSPTMIKTKFPHFFKELPPANKNEKTPLNLDLNYFDRGFYLNAPKEEEYIKATDLPILSFEELNYQGEYAWVLRNYSTKDTSKKQKSIFTPMLKKPRQHYLFLRAKADKRLAEAAQRAHDKIPFGHLPDAKEGTLPGEDTSLFMKVGNFLDRTFILPREVQSDMRIFRTPDSSTVLQKTNTEVEIGSNQAQSSLKKMIESAPKVQNKKIDPVQEEINFEHEMISNYSKGFMPPLSVEITDTMQGPLLPVKNLFKKKYFLNPVYKTLLQTDIDLFLARQPAAYKIAENQEYHLYEKRKLLEKYYNWLRYYEPFEKMIQLRYEIPDCKSFVDRVYHQQFKGTLRVARRLFKVSFDSDQNPEKRRVLSYDQMLYKDLQANENPFIHEELFNKDLITHTESGQIGNQASSSSEDLNNPRVFDHKRFDPENSPFIEESNSSPTYAGWDDTLRRFVITNRFTVIEDSPEFDTSIQALKESESGSESESETVFNDFEENESYS
uniref:hypothetical chloroplast RF1 n=1 Tax=Massjukichlorella minus TaxID=2650457 RepID=UPI002410EEB4|nr:hypothetical chloroplast RF1 [Massjukichlorella minus]WDY12979.1 hypothetical chloroplast RF1 [Massjukichlorella minus]